MEFIHLHNHTHYSLLDGLTKIDGLIEKAKEQGSRAVAITDHGVMYGVIEFYQKCKKAGIKPIIGVEAYLAPNSRHDKNTRDDARNYHLILLAKNNEGYKNLIKLTSIAHLEGFYYKPRIDWEVLRKHSKGLIALSACMGGEIPKLIRAGKMDRAKEKALEYNELFGQGSFYLELQDHPNLEGQKEQNDKMIELGKELNIPVVATNDAHYLNKEDDEAQDILLCIHNKKTRDDTDRMNMMGNDFSIRETKEMNKVFEHIPEAIENTVKIADMCNVDIELGNTQLPFFKVPNEHTEDSYLKELCEKGIVDRFNVTYEEASKEITERMDYELSVIEKMGWPSYFLIVADFVVWAKERGIVVGPGRGSAAGSLVCYLVGITNIDPLSYELLFERFLNPDRVSMPDIDLDFADTRRDEVIKYVEDKYGKNHVAQIITFGTMAARASVRDVGRVLAHSYDYCDKLAKMIPMFTKLKEAISTVPELKKMYEEEDAAKEILDYAMSLEGVSRHSSTHACGVLITKEPLTEYVPLQYASSADKVIVSQYSLHPVEDLGLLKMDFLGLKNLTIIESAVKIIKNTRGIEIDIDEIPLDDQETFKLFQDGRTTGVFQFESSGMKRYLKELKPTEFEDIIAMVALYRPGPMEWIPDYINGKHKRRKVVYLHEKLEKILEKTYGVAIYQEQVMQIARDLAGFTMADADVLRKAMGKKIPELLKKQKEKFIDGCVKNEVHQNLAEKVFSFIEPFAGYGFNRSHAACYALIGYQTAYLKTHWPTEFMAALLTADQQNTDRIAIEIDECRNMGINILPPDINESFSSFTVVTSGTKDNKIVSENEKIEDIRFGLNAIKNVGENITKVIIKERKENGPFSDIFNFLERVTDRDLNKKSLESLIKSGGLDAYGSRGQLLGNVEKLLNFNKEVSKAQLSNQVSLFAGTPDIKVSGSIQLSEGKKIDQQEKLAWEKELLGLYISEHPFNEFKPHLEGYITPIANLAGSKGVEAIKIAGVVSTIKKIVTRNNKSMLFVKIEDTVSNTELLIFPNLYQSTMDIWVEGKVVLCQGTVSDKDDEVKILVDKVAILDLKNITKSIDDFKRIKVQKRRKFPKKENNGGVSVNNAIEENNAFKLIIFESFSPDQINELKEIFGKYPGDDEVYLKIMQGDEGKKIKLDMKVDNGDKLVNEIQNKFEDLIKVVK